MIRIRFMFVVMSALFLILGTAVAQDAGQYLILNAQYGNEQNYVDVTTRLKNLATRDRPFRISDESMEADPARGQAKMLRVWARGPNGEERSFDFPDGSVFDGAQFRGYGRGDWANEQWNGGWNGRQAHEGNRGRDAGQFVILSAQYGSRRRHVDVTNQLKQMARSDDRYRIDFRTFGVDPDRGHAKVLRIFARGPHGHERMFEYQDGSVIDGSIFRGWRRGEWADDNDRWSGRWNVDRDDHDRR